MKTVSNYSIAFIVFIMFVFSCTKTETVYVPTDPAISGSLTFNGDTTIVTAENITIKYYSSSPCYPSNEVFYYQVTTTNYPSSAVYKWDFGDGGSAEGIYVQHKYAYGNVYTLSLKIQVNNVTVQEVTTAIKPFGQYVSPVASFYSQLNNNQDPNYVAFNAQSSVTSGSIVAYHWDWKDGTISNVATSYTEHRFPEIAIDSNYPVQLTVTSHAGCNTSTSNNVFVPASYTNVGGISYTKTPACYPDSQVFTFTQDPTGLPSNTIYEWNFGDGTGTFTGNPVKHHYVYSKTYPIVCTIRILGNSGINIKSLYRNTSVYALGDDIEPKAYMNLIKPLNPPTNTQWEFNGWGSVGDGQIITKLVWEYGDGVIDTNNTPYTTHTYVPITSPASYTVKLTVTASSGCAGSVITVPPITIP